MKNNTNGRNRLLALAALLLALAPAPTLAVPALVLDAGGEVIGVDNLQALGMTYNARWTQGSFDAVGQNPPVFVDQFIVQSTVNQIRLLFNTIGVTAADLGGGLSCTNALDCDLVLAWRVRTDDFDAVNVDWEPGAGSWNLQNQIWQRGFSSSRNAQVGVALALVASEPLTVALTGLGFLGIAWAHRCRRRR